MPLGHSDLDGHTSGTERHTGASPALILKKSTTHDTMRVTDAYLMELQIEDLMYDLDQVDLTEIETELAELDSAISDAIATN